MLGEQLRGRRDMRAILRVLVVVLTVVSVISLSNVAFAKTSVIATYFPNIYDCDGGGGWFVSVTGDDGVTNTYLFCDGGYIP
jgi:hypothetical protein